MRRPGLTRSATLACVSLWAAAFLFAGCRGGDDGGSESSGCAAGDRSKCVVGFALGQQFGCARLFDRSVWCWGQNDESQLGYATTDLCPIDLATGQTSSVACHPFPFQVVGLDSADQVLTGARFACALRIDGSVWCWGANDAGQLGRGDTRPSLSPAPVQGLTNVTALALGARHACAVASAALFCWGADDALQLGIAAPSQLCQSGEGESSSPCETQPQPVPGLGRARGVTAGLAHTCAITDSGQVECWGANDFGQLGGGSASDAPAAQPRLVSLGASTMFASTISAGDYHTCAFRSSDGAVFCWGRDDHGELGIEPPTTVPDHCAAACSPSPVLVASLPGAPTTGPGLPVATDDGGEPSDLGSGGDDENGSGAPVVGPITPPVSIASGGAHTCAVLSDSTLRCWGSDSSGELGDGLLNDGPEQPLIVIAHPGAALDNPLLQVNSVAAGATTSCALLTDGSLRCWGSNESGALGDGDLVQQNGPVPVVW